ncbi:hypothetical protein TNCV_4022481 [Trichonephila clavipes]|nr:hypothetical protein TNCV_4022481 [Trichonephila clavipes]
MTRQPQPDALTSRLPRSGNTDIVILYLGHVTRKIPELAPHSELPRETNLRNLASSALACTSPSKYVWMRVFSCTRGQT